MIGLIFGFVTYLLTKSFLLAFLGYILGSYVGGMMQLKNHKQQNGQGQQFRGRTVEDIFNHYQNRSSRVSDIPTILMALSAAVMKADGKAAKIELEYVKAFFRMQFGNQFTPQHLQALKNYLNSDIPLAQICSDVRLHLRPEARLQLIHYLFGIAKADGNVEQNELNVIANIANMMGVPQQDFISVKNMFYRNVDSDYKILGIEQSASDDEVKKAYRKMAIKFHPDKVTQMGEEFQKGAKEKFQKIQEAYENIKKRRGMK